MSIFKNENGTAAKKSGSSPNYDDNFAHVEPSVTASQAYSVGKFLVFNGRLYRVISPISQGDTLSVNSNIALTNVTDEFENITPPEAEEVEWSVWNAMTEAERDAYSAGKKLDIINVPGADGTISSDLMTLLWENPNPNVAFPAQTITLSSSDYDYLMILPKYNTTSLNYIPPLIVEKNRNGYIIFTDYSGANAASVFRGVSVSNGTSVSFTLTYSNLSVYHQKDTLLLPWKIYGIKKTINIKFDAIASDVSTTADKCMLSDGITSVEEKLTSIEDSTIKRSFINNRAEYDVNITSYNSADNMYTVPRDGYVFCYPQSGKCVATIGRSGWVGIQANSSTGYQALFVQKGQQIRVSATENAVVYYRA